MLFFRQHALRKGRTNEIQLSWREINWAYHSDSQDILSEFVSRQNHNVLLWENARESGIFMWLTDMQQLVCELTQRIMAEVLTLSSKKHSRPSQEMNTPRTGIEAPWNAACSTLRFVRRRYCRDFGEWLPETKSKPQLRSSWVTTSRNPDGVQLR